MNIGKRLRQLRESRGLSQADIEVATGLPRCYTSRIENGHGTPTLGTLEKYAEALGVPLYQLLYEGRVDSPLPEPTGRKTLEGLAREPGQQGAGAKCLLELRELLPWLDESSRQLVLVMARKLARAYLHRDEPGPVQKAA